MQFTGERSLIRPRISLHRRVFVKANPVAKSELISTVQDCKLVHHESQEPLFNEFLKR